MRENREAPEGWVSFQTDRVLKNTVVFSFGFPLDQHGEGPTQRTHTNTRSMALVAVDMLRLGASRETSPHTFKWKWGDHITYTVYTPMLYIYLYIHTYSIDLVV